MYYLHWSAAAAAFVKAFSRVKAFCYDHFYNLLGICISTVLVVSADVHSIETLLISLPFVKRK